MTRTNSRLALLVSVLTLVALPAVVAAAEEDELAAARAATEDFQDATVAEAAGYARPTGVPLAQCIASLDNTGAMGVHYINGDAVGDAVLDPGIPEALVYEQGGDGTPSLVALEYVVFAEAWDADNDSAPVLFEQEFMLVAEPNRYELPAFYALHVWVWKDNPSGLYASFNPEVRCGMPGTSVTLPASTPPIAFVGIILVCISFELVRRQAARTRD